MTLIGQSSMSEALQSQHNDSAFIMLELLLSFLILPISFQPCGRARICRALSSHQLTFLEASSKDFVCEAVDRSRIGQ